MSEKFVLAIDQGTTSSRAIVFNHEGKIVGSEQEEHEQIFPRAGWVEHDPLEIWAKVQKVVDLALADAGKTKDDIVAVGITNQRETTVVWNKETGQPVYNAIVWQDTRTGKIIEELGGGNQDKYKERVGLPLATYFCCPKVKWILDNVPGARDQAEGGKLVMGTIDSWVIWNLTGGVNGGVHITDVTNASRTMLMDLTTLSWDAEIAADMTIPMSMLPEIKSSAEVYGTAVIPSLAGIPVAGDRDAGQRRDDGGAVHLGGGLDLGQHAHGDRHVRGDLGIPAQGREIHEHRARGVGDVGDVHAAVDAAGQVPDDPAVDGAHDELAALSLIACAGDVVEDPLDLGTTEVRGQGQTHALLVLVLVPAAELFDDLAGTGVLPHDCVVDRLSGLLVPDDRGLALVGDTYRDDVVLRLARIGKGEVDDLLHLDPDLQRVMLDPAGPGEDLLVLFLLIHI